MADNGYPTFTFQQLIDDAVLEIGDGYRAKNDELGGSGPIFLRAGHVTDSHIDFDGVEHFRSELTDKVRHKMARPGDTIVTTKGNSTGRTSFVTDEMPPFVYSPHLSYWRSADPNRIESGFLRYWSRGREFAIQLAGMKASTDMAPYLSLTDQRRLEITLPPIDQQKALGAILSGLDDKIELNRRMNATLEGMARAIFKAWFIDFEPVKAKAAGAACFPGMAQHVFDDLPNSFVNSELGEIPEGWSIGPLGNVMEHPRRTARPEELDSTTNYVGLEHIPRQAIWLPEWGDASSVTSNKHYFRKGEFLFGKLRPYFHKVCVAPIDGVCSTDVVVVAPASDGWTGFVLFHISSAAFVAYTSAASTGTKMPRTNWKDMSSYAVAIPPDEIARAFSQLVAPSIALLAANVFESRVLSSVRDALLPKLISGEISVTPIGGGSDGG
ncbi:MAG: restriction endonuclease subunit S [Planctomycetes bacterium]|nr:restriction endonuclease subunit S [Planctomycetota bacterium]